MSGPSAALQSAPLLNDPFSRPVPFVAGHFSGRTIRVQLDELQHAEVGRKCGTKDRRPLDPPPVVGVRLFEVVNAGTPFEEEHELLDPSEVDSHGFICYAELYASDQQALGTSSAFGESRASSARLMLVPSGPGPPSLPPLMLHHVGSSSQMLPGPGSPQTMTGEQPTIVSPIVNSHSMGGWTNFPLREHNSFSMPAAPLGMTTGGNMASYYPAITGSEPMSICPADPQSFSVGNQPCCTELLVGSTFVASTFVEQPGKKIVFAFADLAVKEDGLYSLRYKVFNIFNIALGSVPAPVLAGCCGDAFRVYSTKDFPGLHASTELTKQISRMGVRINSREHERKRRAPSRGSGGVGRLMALATRPGSPSSQAAGGHESAYLRSLPHG
ncbi:hypothetical protein DAEQUDRAFT_717843 [Daedalea quercina L-15889]|uniref:Velvet domain-containing protein n=1 Tax=Daedalea quercina L-15889 TaxID=1314783 RepID=A0A165LM82_9APHY|nr:hypothetical protein DAEQUDRAFT_717843 [Daedalea quercina L-15889]